MLIFFRGNGRPGDIGSNRSNRATGPPGVANRIKRAVHGIVRWDGVTEGTGFYLAGIGCTGPYPCLTEIWFAPTFDPANRPVPCQVAKLGQDNPDHDSNSTNHYYYTSGSALSVFYTNIDGQSIRLGFLFIRVQ